MVEQHDLAALRYMLGGTQILVNEPMSKHTTFKIGGPAEVYIEPLLTLVEPVVSYCRAHNIPCTILGNGSNVLVRDAGIEGVVISLSKPASNIFVSGNKITAEAGALLSMVAAKAADESLGGMETLAGIPGTVGGAVVMNAGAYGGEIKDVIESAQVLLPNGNVETWSKDDLDLSYRHSRVQDENAIVLSATFVLESKPIEEIHGLMDECRAKRVDKQPLDKPSAGSTFKRPEGYFAGKLIEDAGLRGFRVGGAGVSEKHCGFVVNEGGATAEDVLKLMAEVRAKVFAMSGVTLEPEVKIIGKV